MAERIKLVQGDTGPQLRLTLTDESTGEAIALSGATVRLHFRQAGSDTVLFTRTAYINPTTADQGVCIIPWQTGDLDRDEGSYEGEVEAVFNDGMRQTVYDILKFYIRTDFQ